MFACQYLPWQYGPVQWHGRAVLGVIEACPYAVMSSRYKLIYDSATPFISAPILRGGAWLTNLLTSGTASKDAQLSLHHNVGRDPVEACPGSAIRASSELSTVFPSMPPRRIMTFQSAVKA